MSRYILALDQGTTSSRAILFDHAQNIVGIAQKEFTQFYPRQGWVEHDPQEIYSSQFAVMMEVIAQTGIEPSEIAGIGIVCSGGANDNVRRELISLLSATFHISSNRIYITEAG